MKPGTYPRDDLAGTFRTHQPELVRLAAFILGDKAAGEDVVQDVFVRIHQRVAPIDRDPLPYLRSVSRSPPGRHMASPSLVARPSLLSPGDAAPLRPAQICPGLSFSAPASRRQGEVLVLRFGLAEAENAETLGISPGTVKSTAARGLAALAQALKETP